MPDFFKDVELWIAIISLAISGASLYLSIKHESISKKQGRLTLRLEKIILLSELMSLFERNNDLLKDDKEPDDSNDFLFECLTNSPALSDCTDAITHTLESSYQRKFLTSIEELRRAAMESELIFSGEEAKSLETFLQAYADALNELYRYQIVLNKMDRVRKEYPDRKFEEIQGLTKEPQRLQERNLALKKLRNEYDSIKCTGVEEKLKKQVRF